MLDEVARKRREAQAASAEQRAREAQAARPSPALTPRPTAR